MTLNLLEIAALAMLGGALALGLLRLALGPQSPDRIVAADTLSVITTAGLAGLAALLGPPSIWTSPSSTGCWPSWRWWPSPAPSRGTAHETGR